MEAPPPITLSKIFAETKRVIKSQPRRFLALAFLFHFPTSVASLLFQALRPFLSLKQHDQPTIIFLFLAIIYLLSHVLLICAIGSITYTALHGFNGEPVDLKATIKSISTSFFPLLATLLLIFLVVFTASFLVALMVIAISPSPYFLVFLKAIFVVAVTYLQSNWYLVYPIVVAKSRWGFKAAKQGFDQGKEIDCLGFDCGFRALRSSSLLEQQYINT